MKRRTAALCAVMLVVAPAWAGGGRATVESIEILIAESFPVQVFAVLHGYLSDGCTKIAGSASRGPQDNRFDTEIATQRPPEAMRAFLLARAMAAIFVDRRSRSLVSQGRRV